MIERPMPQDILKFKTKFVAGLTVRQCVFALICVVVACFGFFVLFESIEAPKIRIAATSLIVVPFGVVGFVEIMEQPFEKVAYAMLIDNFIAPAVRKKEYRHPELEKWEKKLDGKTLTEEEIAEMEAEEAEEGKKNKKKQTKTKIKKSKEFVGMK